MLWQDVIDQERVVEALRRAIERGRVAHAYLFIGPDGVGKRAVALAFAQALQCERSEGDPCGTCNACSKVARLIHPDVHFLFAQPKDTPVEEVTERLQLLAENPYRTVDFVRRPVLGDAAKETNKQAFYDVDRVHDEILRAMSFRPVEGRYKVVVVSDADRLHTSGANAFLKLLEEPPPQTVFVLTTARADRLLPTILSRCQRLRFDLLSPESIQTALTAREGVESGLAATLARMADGSYSRALELAGNEELLASRQLVLDFLRATYARNPDRLADLAETMAGMGRERLKGVFTLLLRWMRDLLLFKMMGEEAPLVNVDQTESIRKFCNNIPNADLGAMVALVEQAGDLVGRNVHQGLILTTLAQRLHAAMQGNSRVLYEPLVQSSPAPA